MTVIRITMYNFDLMHTKISYKQIETASLQII